MVSVILSTSLSKLSTSNWILNLSSSVFVSFPACTPSSLTLCNIELISFIPPSATCNNDTPSSIFLSAWDNPLICAFILSEIASPAASSAAEFILNPELNFLIAFVDLTLFSLNILNELFVLFV